jgi:hypothetical protein
MLEKYELTKYDRLIQFTDERLTQSDPYVRVILGGVTMARTEVVNNSKMQSTLSEI